MNDLIKRITENLPKEYITKYDIDFCGKKVDALSVMEITSGRKMLQIMTVDGASAYSAEFSVFINVDNLDENSMNNFFEYFETIHDAHVKFTNPDHEFTFITVYIMANNKFSTAVEKMIKKFKFDRKYKKQGFGFTSGRLLVVCENKIYTNSMGKDLQRRIKDNM